MDYWNRRGGKQTGGRCGLFVPQDEGKVEASAGTVLGRKPIEKREFVVLDATLGRSQTIYIEQDQDFIFSALSFKGQQLAMSRCFKAGGNVPFL